MKQGKASTHYTADFRVPDMIVAEEPATQDIWKQEGCILADEEARCGVVEVRAVREEEWRNCVEGERVEGLHCER
jgi:hypothetical protein